MSTMAEIGIQILHALQDAILAGRQLQDAREFVIEQLQLVHPGWDKTFIEQSVQAVIDHPEYFNGDPNALHVRPRMPRRRL